MMNADELFSTAKKILKQSFGFSSFRPAQEAVIQNIFAGKDTLALLPTGGGKSICYQIPALVYPGTCIVVSPLLALMKDQVDNLVENGIAAAALNSQISPEESYEIRNKAIRGELKLLYLSPERIHFELDHLLSAMRTSLFAIDEAHCISVWGHDFRPEYAELHTLRKRFPQIPLVALTATADAATRKDILSQLQIPAENTVLSSFDRPNLSLNVKVNLKKMSKMSLQDLYDQLLESRTEYELLMLLGGRLNLTYSQNVSDMLINLFMSVSQLTAFYEQSFGDMAKNQQ